MNIYDLLILVKKNKLEKFTNDDLIRLSKLPELEARPLLEELIDRLLITAIEQKEVNNKRFYIFRISNAGNSYIKETKSQLSRTIRHDILSILAVIISTISLAISFFK